MKPTDHFPSADPQTSLLDPAPLAHSQELEDQLPQVRRHVGPRLWYQCLETWTTSPDRSRS